MPSRLITALILAFWLGMTALLLEREVVPMMLAEVAPTFQIDLTDEIGSPLVGWNMLADGKRAGSATSRIVALDDRRFEFRSAFHFDQFIPGLKTIESTDRVSEQGKLQAVALKVVFAGVVYEIEGDVAGQKLKPRVLVNSVEFKGLVGEIDVSAQANMVSSLKMVNRLRGLHDGQTWTETPFDPSQGLQNKLAANLFAQFKTPTMIAVVKSKALHWDRKQVDCHVVEYHDANKEVVARVWVRKRDGLVLQREAAVLGKELVLQRMPS